MNYGVCFLLEFLRPSVKIAVFPLCLLLMSFVVPSVVAVVAVVAIVVVVVVIGIKIPLQRIIESVKQFSDG